MQELKAIFLGLVSHNNEEKLPTIYMVAENNNIDKSIIDEIVNQVRANPVMMQVNLQTNVGQVEGAKSELIALLGELDKAGVIKNKDTYLTLLA